MKTIGLCVFAVAVSGCLSRTGGQLGHASFSWEECLFGCETSTSSMAAGGAHAVISVDLHPGYTFSSVRSSQTGVATFSIGNAVGGTSIDAVSGIPGTTTLQLLDGNGNLVDETAITVEATAKLAVTQGWSGAAPLILAGSPQTFHVTTKDFAGNTTIGTGSVRFQLSGALAQSSVLVGGDAVGFTGSPGVGSVTAISASGPTATLNATVVPLSTVNHVDATVEPNSMSGTTVYAHVKVVASTANGPVYGATCNWQTASPYVTVYTQSPTSLEQAPSTEAQLQLSQAGSFTATCVVGGAAATVQLTR